MNQGTFVSSVEWNIDRLVNLGPRFNRVPRIPRTWDGNIEDTVGAYEKAGIPLIIEGLHHRPGWSSELFDIEWFKRNADQALQVRNVYDGTDKVIPLSEFIDNSQASSRRASSNENERLYAKDIKCPEPWKDWLTQAGVIPTYLRPEGPGDIMKHLPASVRVENLLCYLGIGDTFTPCHKDLCASSGHNLMCYTEDSSSAFWFMTKSEAAPVVAKYFQSLNQEIDWENHTISIADLARAPFDVYIAEQKLGDFVLVPPRSCHQVINHGGLSVKMSWSRMTIKGAATALCHELPIYRRVCRPEVYRIKSTIHHTLLHHTATLLFRVSEFASEHIGYKDTGSQDDARSRVDLRKLADELQTLLKLFHNIMVDEYRPNPGPPVSVFYSVDYSDGGYAAYACDFCGSDIFLSFYICQACVPIQAPDDMAGTTEALHICPGCYAEGRTCLCGSMKPMQLWSQEVLVQDYNQAVRALRRFGIEGNSELRRSGELESEGYIGLFHAGDILDRWRSSTSIQEYTCRAMEGTPHRTLSSETLPCQQCHKSSCLAHLARHGIHASQAINAHPKRDIGHKSWHQFHLASKKSFNENKSTILDAELSGDGVPNLMAHRLAIAATTFPYYQPINTAYIRPGWYDKELPSIALASSSLHTAREQD